MALPHAAAGEMIDLHPYGECLPEMASTALYRSDRLEVLRLVLPRGRAVPQHHLDHDITVQCIEGEVEIRLGDRREVLQPWQMLCLAPHTAYALRALRDASLLLTVMRAHVSRRDPA